MGTLENLSFSPKRAGSAVLLAAVILSLAARTHCSSIESGTGTVLIGSEA